MDYHKSGRDRLSYVGMYIQHYMTIVFVDVDICMYLHTALQMYVCMYICTSVFMNTCTYICIYIFYKRIDLIKKLGANIYASVLFRH